MPAMGTRTLIASVTPAADTDTRTMMLALHGGLIAGRVPVWSGRQTAMIDHSLLVLELGLQRMVADPTVVFPRPSSAVPVPRLMMW